MYFDLPQRHQLYLYFFFRYLKRLHCREEIYSDSHLRLYVTDFLAEQKPSKAMTIGDHLKMNLLFSGLNASLILIECFCLQPYLGIDECALLQPKGPRQLALMELPLFQNMTSGTLQPLHLHLAPI